MTLSGSPHAFDTLVCATPGDATTRAPNFVKVAESYGIRGISINNSQDLNDNIKDILEYDGPILVDIRVVPDENCYPMVAPGKSNAQMMGV